MFLEEQFNNGSNQSLEYIDCTVIPKIVFIVPYRDREQHQSFFARHMKYILEDMDASEYKILYIHQCDTRSFNRGAMKNIGFLVVKDLYPNDYKNISLIFNDIDTLPLVKNVFDYETTPHTVKHFYGFDYALGGIVSMRASDFESINGFPNYWVWGYEDNMLQKRVQNANMKIDRSQFYPFFDKNILSLPSGFMRDINKKEFNRFTNNVNEGIRSISRLHYQIKPDGFVDITLFSTGSEPVSSEDSSFDIRTTKTPYKKNAPQFRKGYMKMVM